ncbi:hypothetical protein V2J09_002429 [Rumex salicifolius]
MVLLVCVTNSTDDTWLAMVPALAASKRLKLCSMLSSSVRPFGKFGWVQASRILQLNVNKPTDAIAAIYKWNGSSVVSDFIVLVWIAWTCHNLALFQEPLAAPFLRDGFKRLLSNYSAVRIASLNSSLRVVVAGNCSRTPPSAGFMKINTDAVFLSMSTSLGAIYRDHNDAILFGCVRRLSWLLSPKTAELEALKLGVELAVLKGYTYIILESDALACISHLRSDVDFLAPWGIIVDDIRSLSSLFISCSFVHVMRDGNTVAHLLSRACPMNELLQVFDSDVSQGVDELAAIDLL